MSTALFNLIKRNLIYYRRSHIGTLTGTAIATAVLVGALIVGDSVRFSLSSLVTERLGRTQFALDMDERYFRAKLASDLAERLSTTVAPVLRTRGIALLPTSDKKAEAVQVFGVEENFGLLGNTESEFFRIADNEVIINRPLAEEMGLQPGDYFLLRLLKLQYLSADAPFSRDSDQSIATRLRVKAIASDREFGHFNLKSHQIVPRTVFMSLSALNGLMGLVNRANVVLIAARNETTLQQSELMSALKKVWSFEDIGLYLQKRDNSGSLELKSDQIFIPTDVIKKIQQLKISINPVFTYFVNGIVKGEATTPYSFVSAPGLPLVPQEMQDDEIIVNSWLASDLEIRLKDRILLKYYIIGSDRKLTEKSREFQVSSIVPTAGIYADQTLMPDFPGLAGTENCRDWDPGIPIDLDNIRPQDEAYWDTYRGVPKAFVTLKAAQELWGNRFGELTAIRFSGMDGSGLRKDLDQLFDPQDYGFFFREVAREGARASQESVDFAELFLGLSFFVIVAALLLIALLFILSMARRAPESGLYYALGYPKQLIRRMLLLEYGLLAILGGVIGAFLAVFYNQIILFALGSFWKGAVGTSALKAYIDTGTILTGTAAAILVVLLTLTGMIEKQAKRTVRGLQTGYGSEPIKIKKKAVNYSLFIASISLSAALAIILITGVGKDREAAAAFFASGFLLLISGIGFSATYFNKIQKKSARETFSLATISRENMTRNKGRSLMLVGLLASGLFIIFTVSANRHGELQNPLQRNAGTGGFALMADLQMPVLYDLNTENGRNFYGLEDYATDSVKFVQLRVKEGEDASCLNLNRVSTPQLLGVDPQKFARLNAFTFSSLTNTVGAENPWSALERKIEQQVIPGIADETVIIWGLGKTVGDTILYKDEKGNLFQVKLIAGLANSVFQGNILISEKNFIEKYPSVSGYRLLLVDTPLRNTDALVQSLSWGMQDLGITVSPTAARLDAFNQVENTYLSIFLILGGFGLILGTIGLGIVVMRNVIERRGELALLKAVGFRYRKINTLIVAEHIYLLLMGSICGLAASLIAVLPALLIPGNAVPFREIAILFLLIIMNGMIWTYGSVRLSTGGDLIPSLRNE